jgi:cytochrome c oxidase cbb3-type subunit 1
MNNAAIPFIAVVQHTIPYLLMRSVSGIVITVGHVAFAVNVLWMLSARRPAGDTVPTLFHSPASMQTSSVR